MDFTQIIKLATGLFAVLNPLGGLSIFAAITSDRSVTEQRTIGGRTARSICIILLASALAGDFFLSWFGIRIGAFRIAGGILLLMMALSMLQAKQSNVKQSPEESVEAHDREDIAVVPLAIPVFAGPGTISTVILYAQDAVGWQGWLVLIGIIVMVSVWIYALLYFAPLLIKRLGKTGLNVISRVMGLILAALAVEFIVAGLQVSLPVLG